MSSCRSAVLVLLLIIINSTAAESVTTLINGKLHHSAVLPCSGRCSGVARWTLFHKPMDPLAECDQTSCRSVERYQMIYNQYLQGNLSLIITEADFSKRARYICDCDGKGVCDVRLQIEPLKTSVQMKPGGSLPLDLDVPEPVEVVLYTTGKAGRSGVQLCTVDGRSVQCEPEYTRRTSLSLELRGMKPSDSGMYIVRDTMNDEDIHAYIVSVKDDCESEALNQPKPEEPTTAAADEQLCCCCVPVWAWAVMVVQSVALLVNVFWQRWRRTWRLQTRSEWSGVNVSQNGVQMNGQSNPEQHRLSSTDGPQVIVCDAH